MDVTSLMRRQRPVQPDCACARSPGDPADLRRAWDRGCQMANALIELGLEPGDRVGVLEDNSVEAADFFLGAAIANLVRVPLYPRNADESHLHMLGTPAAGRRGVEQPCRRARWHRRRRSTHSRRDRARRRATRTGWLAQSDDDPTRGRPDDNYIIRHTGGTTGLSKGVAYTHKSWLDAGRDWTYGFPPIEPGDRCLHVGPISHGSGYLYVPIFLSGGCNVLLDHFDPAETLDVMEPSRSPTCSRSRPCSTRSRETRAGDGLVAPQGPPDRGRSHRRRHRPAGPRGLRTGALSAVRPDRGTARCLHGPEPVVRRVEGSTPLRAAGLPFRSPTSRSSIPRPRRNSRSVARARLRPLRRPDGRLLERPRGHSRANARRLGPHRRHRRSTPTATCTWSIAWAT